MTDVTFQPPGSGFTFDWSDGAVWSDGTPPNSSNLDVVIPALDAPGTGTLAAYVLTIGTGESFKTGSIAVTNDYLDVAGTLSIANALTLASGDAQLDLNGGTITLGALSDENDYVLGSGTIDSTGTIVNDGAIQGSGLTLDAAALHNDDALLAYEGDLTVNVTGGSNLSNGVLTGGLYGAAGGGTLLLDLGSIVTTDAATITLGQVGDGTGEDNIESVAASTHDPLPLQSTLGTIAATGVLELDAFQYQSTGTLSVSGALLLRDSAEFSSPGLYVAPTGLVSGDGEISGPITNNGTIIAPKLASASDLYLDGPVSGTGTLVVGALPATGPESASQSLISPTLELNGASSESVIFAGPTGYFNIDHPSSFTGTITANEPAFSGGDDVISLGDINSNDVTGLSYTGGANAGVLTVDTGNGLGEQSINVAGNVSDWSVSAYPGENLSTGPSEAIVIAPQLPAPTLGLVSGSMSPAITDSNSLQVTGLGPAGGEITLTVDGYNPVTASMTSPSESEVGTYQSSVSIPTDLNVHLITAATTAIDGASIESDPLYIFTLPSPVDGTVTAPLASAQFAAVLGAGYTTDFTPGTEAIQLTDGTLSVGPDTGAALVQRLYEGLLDRAADPGGLVGYTNILAQYGAGAVASDLLDSSEFATDQGALSTLSASSLVDLLYRGLLGRAPDAGGLASYLGDLAGGTSPGTIAAAIANSAESKAALAADTANVWVPNATGALITDLYQTAFDRTPDLSGLAAYTGALAGGLTPAAMADALAGSAEFKADHAGQDIAGLVTSFYSNGLGRSPDPSGLQFYTGQLESGASVGSVILAIATSQEAAGHLQKTV